MTETKQPEKRAERVLTQNFGLLEFKRDIWFYEVPEQQTKEDLLRPEFWADRVDTIRGPGKEKGLGHLIVLDKPDTGWMAFARINAIGQGFMKISFFSESKPEQVEAPEGPLTTRWNVGRRCHEVFRASSNTMMATGFQQKADALAWIADHLKDMAA
jgi:hypothetical protein